MKSGANNHQKMVPSSIPQLYNNCDSRSGACRGVPVWASFDGAETWTIRRRVRRAQRMTVLQFSGEIHESDRARKKPIWRSQMSFSPRWIRGLEPPTSGTTIRRSNHLSYIHQPGRGERIHATAFPVKTRPLRTRPIESGSGTRGAFRSRARPARAGPPATAGGFADGPRPGGRCAP